MICFETILFALALYKGIQHFRFRARVRWLTNRGGGVQTREMERGSGWRGQKAIDVLIRDSVLYYAV